MGAVNELNAWMRAQLDTDKRLILEAAEGYFYSDGHGSAVNRWFDRWSPDNPEPMLAEIEAIRRILDQADAAQAAQSTPIDYYRGKGHGVVEGLDRAIRLLARRYAARPGYREQWQP